MLIPVLPGFPRRTLLSRMGPIALCVLAVAVAVPSAPIVATAAPSRTKSGPKTRAEELGEQAHEALKASRFEDAISLFTRARDLEPGARWTVELAKAIAASGQLFRARKLLTDFAERAKPGERHVIEAARDELELRIPTLRVQVSGPAPGVATIEIDGARQEKTTYGGVLQLDPGPHVVRVSAPGFSTVEERVQLIESSPHELAVTLQLDAPVDAQPETPVSDSAPAAWKRPTAIGSFVLAGVGVVSGTLFFLKRNGKNGEANDLFDECDPRVCSADERDRIVTLDDEAKSSAILAGVSYGVAAAAAGLGVYLWMDDQQDRSLGSGRSIVVQPGLGSLSVSGRF
jgi:hypothetical protein